MASFSINLLKHQGIPTHGSGKRTLQVEPSAPNLGKGFTSS
jgi:hypothetical protein